MPKPLFSRAKYKLWTLHILWKLQKVTTFLRWTKSVISFISFLSKLAILTDTESKNNWSGWIGSAYVLGLSCSVPSEQQTWKLVNYFENMYNTWTKHAILLTNGCFSHFKTRHFHRASAKIVWETVTSQRMRKHCHASGSLENVVGRRQSMVSLLSTHS